MIKVFSRTARRVAISAGLAACMASVGVCAASSDYPSRPIRLIVPFAAGSATDTVGRVFGEKMSALLGQPIIVENRPGALGMIGADAVTKAAPDGYTLLVGTNTTHAAIRSLAKNVAYDPVKDFTPISFLGVVPQVVIVNKDLPFKTLTDLVDYARANPEKLTYGWTSSVTRVATEMLASMSQVKFFNVPYKAGSAALTDIISGQINFTIVDMIVALPQIQAGKVRALAVTSAQRVSQLPDLPTVSEALELPDYELVGIFAAFGPAGLPPDILAKLNAAINKAGQDPDLRARFGKMGLTVETTSSEQLRERFAAETARWSKVATEAGIEPQ